MLRWWPAIKQGLMVALGLGLIAYMTWSGFTQIFRALSTGEVLARYGDRASRAPSYSKLIGYADAPFDFVGNIVLAVLMAAGGVFIWTRLMVKIHQWWNKN